MTIQGSRRIIGLFPELLSPGGIQRAGGHVAAVLAELSEGAGVPYRFLSLNDAPGAYRLRAAGRTFEFQGFGRSKRRFCTSALESAPFGRPLVVAAHPHLAPLAWGIRAVSPGSRAVVLTHGIEVWRRLATSRRWPLCHVDAVLAPSTDTLEKLIGVQGVPPARVRRVPWGLDPDFGASASSASGLELLERLAGKRLILTVARLAASERYKGVDALIRVLPRLQERVPEARLLVVGDGDDLPRLRDLAAEVGASASISFLGVLPQDTLVTLYRACDVFAMPSHGEGFGLVFLEAMSMGKPVIGGAQGGTRDIVADGETGFLVANQDHARLGWALEQLLTDRELCARIGRQARESVSADYLFDHFRGRLSAVLHETCGS